jgi:serine/threonine protein kinase
MLQYTVVPPTLANSAFDNPDYFRNNDRLTSKRVPKDTSSPIISNFSEQTTAKSPRSPYISTREPETLPPPRPSSIVSTIDDVLIPGDAVKEGGLLQGEPLRLVTIGSKSLPEDEEPAREFEVVRRLGAGSYAVVYLVLEVLYRPPPSDDGHITVGQMDSVDKHRRPSTVYGREYAIKCLSKANLDEEALAAQMSEVTIHQSLRSHPNIVTLHRTLETSSFLLLLLEYVPGEDLFYFLEQARDHYDTDSPNGSTESSSSHTPPTPSLLSSLLPSQLLSRTRLRLISSMFSQMCDAVAACHDQQVFHRDIKPENFIVTDGWTTHSDGHSERKVVVKLTDFGLSTTDIESSDMDCGSAPYMSYECRNNIAPTYRPRAADVWSLGIVLINMLYHCNPWTDTAQYACGSFDLYRQHPVNFFLQRFAGMTKPVAQFLTDRVFNILEDGNDDFARISAKGFGEWAKDLPDLLGPPAPAIPNGSSHHRRHTSVSSTTGHPISSAVPPSHRPSSRQATPVIQPRILTGLPVSRPPSLGPALVSPLSAPFTRAVDQDLVVEEAEEELEPEPDQEDNTPEGMTSRSTSTTKRRKRGARKGKGSTGTPTAPKDETLITLASASQTLARELSRTSMASSRHTDSIKSGKSGRSNWSIESSKSKKVPFEPPSMFGIPSALLSASGPAVLPPVPPVPPLPPVSTVSATTQTTPLPAVVTKKPSKWKLSFGKNSGNPTSANGRASPVDEAPPSTVSAGTQTQPLPAMSATASNVTSLIMGLNAPPPHSAPATTPPSNAPPDESLPSWNRGRRVQRAPDPSFSVTDTTSRSDLKAPSVPRSVPSSSSPSRPYFTSSSPIPSMERSRERARRNPNPVDNDGRAVSPSSTRTGRHSHVASSASSMISNSGAGSSSGSTNWRNSMSSAATSTSAFTHYSNSSMRSVSTMATSVSSNSWRNGNKSPTSPVYGHPPGVPKNIKIMDGVPWELNQVPRGQHPNPDFGKPPPRKARTRKPKDLKLDTITERPPASSAANKKSPDFMRQDASTSTTDLGGASSRASAGGSDDGDWQNKKVQRGQINALAKMLSALRR